MAAKILVLCCSQFDTVAWSVYFWAIRSLSPIQNQLSFLKVEFSLFALELLLQNEKRKLTSNICYGFQIE